MSSNQGDDRKAETEDLEQKMMQILERWTTTATGGDAGAAQKIDELLAKTSVQLEVFSGNSGSLSAAEWIDRLELAKENGRWSMEKTLHVVLCKLTGPARSWHLRDGTKIQAFDKWKKTFLDTFSPQLRMHTLVKDLVNRKQNDGEPLHTYVWRIAALAAQLGMSPTETKDQILDGLQPEYRFLVHEFREQAHDALPDLIKHIEKSSEFYRRIFKVMKETPYQLHLRWTPDSAGGRPANAVKGGVDTGGEEMFVARVRHKDALIPGKLVPSHKAAFVPTNGVECVHDDYEVLVADCDLLWVRCDTNSPKLPPGAIQAGFTKSGEPLYIGRARHRYSVTCGKVQWSLKKCSLSFNSLEYHYDTFELLTCQTIPLN